MADMIAIVVILILSAIIGGVINDHKTFYGSPKSVKLHKMKAYLIVFVIFWVGMSSVQYFQGDNDDGTKNKTAQSQKVENENSDYNDSDGDNVGSYDESDENYAETDDSESSDEDYDESEEEMDEDVTADNKATAKSKYILPMSSKRKLKEKDLKKLGNKKLRLARNEIYARHGRMFQDEELQDYFDSQDWYTPSIAPEDFLDAKELSKVERKNIAFIRKHES